MLSFREYIQLDETNAQDASTQAQVRAIAFPLVNRIRQLSMDALNDASTRKSLQALHSELLGLAYLICIILGTQTGDRMLIQRGRGTI